ncbi:MAG: hypothetical protein P4L84_21610 [Isosphaeraceae bacterium]|nr:hypothetical protein [Isosphaeraceae bacterium]
MGRATKRSFELAVVFGISTFAAVTMAHGEERSVTVVHQGSVREKHRPVHRFRITLINRDDEPKWFVFPTRSDVKLPADGVFRNYDGDHSQRFRGHGVEGKRGAVFLVEFSGKDSFQALRVPAKSQVKLEWLHIVGDPDYKFDTMTVLEGHRLLVNGKRGLEEWLPYNVTSDRNVFASSCRDAIELDRDPIKQSERTDYPKEDVIQVTLMKPIANTVIFCQSRQRDE